jgi:hypothetical protein
MDEPSIANKWVRRFSLGFAAFCVLFMGFIWLFPRQISAKELAAKYMYLPPQAVVKSAVKGSQLAEVTVEFTLPNTQSPEAWQKAVWTGLGFPVSHKPSKYQLVWDSGPEWRSLVYSPSKKLYTFTCVARK